MKSNKGVTLVALVVTIIVLIILAGISINLILGDNGIITIAKKAKENTELAKIQEETELNELYTQLEADGSNSENLPNDSKVSISIEELKQLIKTEVEKQAINSSTFIDTNNIIKEVCNGTNLNTVSYTAEEDCIISGSIRTWSSDSYATIFVDNIAIYNVGGSDTSYGDYNSIYQPLKKGQTIKIVFSNTNNGTNFIKAYGIKK